VKTKIATISIFLVGLLSFTACNFPGSPVGGGMGIADATPTSVPTTAPVATSELPSPTSAPVVPSELPSPTSTTETLDPTQEPTPDSSERIAISIDNVKQLSLQTTLQHELNTFIVTLDLSNDGRYLVASQRWDPENAVSVWDLQGEILERSLSFHSKDVVDITFSPDGNLIAAGSQDGMVALWEVGSWELVESFLAYPEGVASLAFSPDGSLLAIGGYHNQLGVWRLADGERLHHYDGNHQFYPRKVAFTSDGNEYYADTDYADITSWSTATGELLRSFRGEACIGGFDLSSDETMLAYSSSCSAAQEPHDPLVTIAVRDVASGEALVYGALKETSTRIFFTNDDALILSNSSATIRFWNASDGTLYHQLPKIGYFVEFLLSDDGSLLIVGDADGDVLIYSVEP
jgi:WD40 repeat protein